MKELWSENSIDEGCFYKINWESRTYLKADGKGLVEVGQNRVQRENIQWPEFPKTVSRHGIWAQGRRVPPGKGSELPVFATK